MFTEKVCCGNSKIAAAFLFARQKKEMIPYNFFATPNNKKKGLFKMKKLLSLLLVIIMVITPLSAFAADTNNSITVYVTVSIYGEFAETADGEDAVMLPVNLTESEQYTLDQLFAKTHELYYTPDGYASDTGDYGAYVTKFWGDESGNFGYQVNGGDVAVMGLTHTLEDKDYVDVAIYKSLYPYTEAYSKFDTVKAQTSANNDISLTLYEAGYDENWNTVFSPCENAIITINGEDTEYVTDVEGMVTLSFDNSETYIISAHKEKEVNNETVPAITAPVCEITVSEPDYITITHNIAEKYYGKAITSDTNMVWFIADLAMYNELYPENSFVLSSKTKQTCLDKIISEADKTNTPSTLAKNIIALKAMGYDAKNVYNSMQQKNDIVEKLTILVDANDSAVTNIYTLPYVIIALGQSEEYASDEQMDYLISSAVASKEEWQNNEWGTDAASAMLLALAPYYNANEDVKNAVDETIEIITSAKDDAGLIGNAASTGLAITALSALGMDVKETADGLMTQATEELDGFYPMENSFSTEQGFRGLIAYQLFANDMGRIMYDFSSYPSEVARSTKKTSSGGSSGGGGGSRKPIVKEEKIEETVEEKVEEKVEETPDKQEDKNNKNPDVKIMPVTYPDKTFEDIKGHKNQKEIEALAIRGIINGKTDTIFDPSNTMTRAEFATIITRALGLTTNKASAFSDVKENDWYYSYINTAYHYGIVKGISETEFNPNGLISRQEAAVMVARASVLCGLDTQIDDTDSRDILAPFTDYTQLESWVKQSYAFCFESGIISDEASEILPQNKITRTEVALMVYNMLDVSLLLAEETK